MHNCIILENEFPTSEDFPPSEQYQRRRRGEKRNPPPTSVIEKPQRPTLPDTLKSPHPPKSSERPILGSIVVELGLPPHESNAAQSKLPVNDKPSLEEVLSSPEAPKWRKSMLEELHSIEENDVWEMSSPPPNGRVRGSK